MWNLACQLNEFNKIFDECFRSKTIPWELNRFLKEIIHANVVLVKWKNSRSKYYSLYTRVCSILSIAIYKCKQIINLWKIKLEQHSARRGETSESSTLQLLVMVIAVLQLILQPLFRLEKGENVRVCMKN